MSGYVRFAQVDGLTFGKILWCIWLGGHFVLSVPTTTSIWLT